MMRVDLWVNEDPYLAWAAGYFGDPNSPNAARTADPDGDGFTNEQELAAGTDPTSRASALRLSNFSRAANGSTFTLGWVSVPGKTYQVQTSPNLSSWTDAGSPVTASATSSSTTVSITGSPQRFFYRVRLVP